MRIIRLCSVCGDDAEAKPNDAGKFLCMDHMHEWHQDLKKLCEFDEFEPDEFGRNPAAMRRERAM